MKNFNRETDGIIIEQIKSAMLNRIAIEPPARREENVHDPSANTENRALLHSRNVAVVHPANFSHVCHAGFQPPRLESQNR